jgi:cell wall-associated NlpC family hydrolase
MPASAAWRRLCAFVPLTIAGVVGSALLLAPPASARQLNNPDGETVIQQRENNAANIALSHLGDPYRYGAAGPNAFDCSGLTMWSYGHARLKLPRTAAGQYAAVRHLYVKKNMVRGDLVFFHDSSGHVYHVGMFLYWNAAHRAVIVHAPYPGQRVHRTQVWTTSWYAGTRRPL